ncbi:MAG: SNF2-related protein [Steroidobacteraceae bacterium]
MPTNLLSHALCGDCDATVAHRGAEYFRAGRVRITSGSASRVAASVRGTSPYDVELVRRRKAILASCTCPYFDVDLCKHIWAAVLAAEARGLLQGDGGNRGLHLVHAAEADDEIDANPDEDSDADSAQSDDFDEEGEDIDEAYRRLLAARQVEQRTPGSRPSAGGNRARRSAARIPHWRKRLAQLHPAPAPHYPVAQEEWGPRRELLYLLDIDRSKAVNGLYLEILTRDRKRDGEWSKPKPRYIPRDWVQQFASTEDRRVIACLSGGAALSGGEGARYTFDAMRPFGVDPYGGPASYYGAAVPFRYRLRGALIECTLPLLSRTHRGRVRVQPLDEEPQWLPLALAEQECWELRLALRRAEPAGRYELRGECVWGAERLDLSAPLLLLHDGFLVLRDRIARFEPHGAFEWVGVLRGEPGPLLVPDEEAEAFVAELLRQPRLPPLELPEALRYEEVSLAPRPRLCVKAAEAAWSRDRLQGRLSFDYGGEIVEAGNSDRCIVRAVQRQTVVRDRAVERAAGERLHQLGWRTPTYGPAAASSALELGANRLPHTVRELLGEGWHVEAHGKLYRAPGRIQMGVTSGIDWFELHGTLDFGGAVARLPELLAAARRGEGTVRLGDGSFGLLPEQWLAHYGLLTGLGATHEDHVRFSRSQVGLLDALLAAEPDVERDAAFSRACEALGEFSGITPAEPPVGFRGELRPYQKDGLGWMAFLRRFGFGGCLADDMGLGKTVQVLALLEARRGLRSAGGRGAAARIGPSLAVVPRSLIFNWKAEAARFAPGLRVLDHTGQERCPGSAHFEDYDLVLTTYGTLRRDVLDLQDMRFDYVILDEAQAIKNADSASAKAARLLKADHRLALSGTPVENHLGELWSLFEFLNPGMLGTASVFRLTQGAGRDPDEATRALLARALRPFILRRTKEQVVKELPPKIEQTLYCELEAKQRKLYEELRDHYRGALLARIERVGLARSKIQVLEALLRLRQAALHPGLIDERRAREPSAKLETLLPRLAETLAEGHKALVFSQFTRMLGILRESLDREGTVYAYLDGRTRDREAVVRRFRDDPSCQLFLVSLKAGGLGLNLTAAQYVFLLDPWWNPAVEAQAIDRAHRIGQTNRVIAYRLIARGTIEEKVLELQDRKRGLAEAILGADKSLIRDLRREDLLELLS